MIGNTYSFNSQRMTAKGSRNMEKRCESDIVTPKFGLSCSS